MPVFKIIESREFKVKLVNTRHITRQKEQCLRLPVADAAALRMAAFTLFNSKSALGAYLRRQRSRPGASGAITATVRKLAYMVYAMLKQGTEY
jgi:hypothetical protein